MTDQARLDAIRAHWGPQSSIAALHISEVFEALDAARARLAERDAIANERDTFLHMYNDACEQLGGMNARLAEGERLAREMVNSLGGYGVSPHSWLAKNLRAWASVQPDVAPSTEAGVNARSATAIPEGDGVGDRNSPLGYLGMLLDAIKTNAVNAELINMAQACFDNHELASFESRATCPACGKPMMQALWTRGGKQVGGWSCHHCYPVWGELDAGAKILIEIRDEIARLTRERDEAREEIFGLKSALAIMQAERDRIRDETIDAAIDILNGRKMPEWQNSNEYYSYNLGIERAISDIRALKAKPGETE